jgi:hypothetical protein
VLGLAIAARVAGLAPFHAYPSLYVAASPATLVMSAALVACALLPFADRRGIGP